MLAPAIILAAALLGLEEDSPPPPPAVLDVEHFTLFENVDKLLGGNRTLLPPEATLAGYKRLGACKRDDSHSVTLSGRVALSGFVCARTLTIKDGTRIDTQGQPFELFIWDSLRIQGEATIVAHDGPQSAPPTPPTPAKGAAGQSWNRGPGGEAAAPNASDGTGGGHGAPGATGATGATRPVGSIVIRLSQRAKASGVLNILNRGGDGGRGGAGGEGGDGGDGQQGGRSKFHPVLDLFGETIYVCDAGPGSGGRGGDAGMGGPAGPGGTGADGGVFQLVYSGQGSFEGDVSDLRLNRVDLRPGRPGRPGAPGLPGRPGRGGFGGRGSTACSGKETEVAPGGTPKGIGEPGHCGLSGAPGKYLNLVSTVSPTSLVTAASYSDCWPSIAALCEDPRRAAAAPEGALSCDERRIQQSVWLLLFSGPTYTAEWKTPSSGGGCDYVLIRQSLMPHQAPSPILPFLATYLRTGIQAPSRTCNGGDAANQLSCCLDQLAPATNISSECLATVRFRNDGSYLDKLEKLLFAAEVPILFAAELHAESHLASRTGVSGGALAAGGVHFVWDGGGKDGTIDGENYIVTRLSGRLLQTLSVILSDILPNVREARGSQNAGMTGFLCSKGRGTSAVAADWDHAALNSIQFFVSSGSPTELRRQAGAAGGREASLQVRALEDAFMMHLASFGACPVATKCSDGTANTCLIDGFEALSAAAMDPFECLQGGDGSLLDLKNQLNDPESALVVFGAFYLRAALSAEGLPFLF